MIAECCGSVLERLLASGSRGLESISLRRIPSLAPLARTLVRIILKDDFSLRSFTIDGLDDLEWEVGEEGLAGKCKDTLKLVLRKNE